MNAAGLDRGDGDGGAYRTGHPSLPAPVHSQDPPRRSRCAGAGKEEDGAAGDAPLCYQGHLLRLHHLLPRSAPPLGQMVGATDSERGSAP
eukprot:760129-Hanusia_phi.AAC.1